MRVLTVNNYKGGVGKTTTAVNLAAIFAGRGKRVLLIDLDPQASATDFFGLYDAGRRESRTSIEVLYEGRPIADVAYSTKVDNLFMVPSVIDLADQNELALSENALRYALKDVADNYDVAIMDCATTMKRLSLCSYIAAADNAGLAIIPVKMDASVMRGVDLTIKGIKAASRMSRLAPPTIRLLRTVVPGSQTRCQACGEDILDTYFPNIQFATSIHASTKVGEGSWTWDAVVSFAPKSRPAKDYLALADEVDHALG
ncbi:ParA family protein [Adlercreutzia sp. ZJ141]|uniref:ParA family protein n=1 Tax=Adlercreutzia sp. ZJ141 TaxID=2709406 RepID=UPI0013EB0D71|nr:ParA family protein [Adlercreutzia sp. ZJ141]